MTSNTDKEKEKKKNNPQEFPVYLIKDAAEIVNYPAPCYLIGQNGTFFKSTNEIFDSIQKVEKILSLAEIKEYANWDVGKIQFEEFARIVKFFRKVYDKYYSEARVELFYNDEKRDWFVIVPEQEVSGTGVKTKIDDDDLKEVPPGYKQFGSIHSHANMSAFQSSTDKGDEKFCPGIHITVGSLASTPTFHTRFVVGDATYEIKNIEDIVEGIPEEEVDEKYDIDKVKKETYSYANVGYQHYGKSNYEDESEYSFYNNKSHYSEPKTGKKGKTKSSSFADGQKSILYGE